MKLALLLRLCLRAYWRFTAICAGCVTKKAMRLKQDPPYMRVTDHQCDFADSGGAGDGAGSMADSRKARREAGSGLQPERTSLAWLRTLLGYGALIAPAIKHNWHRTLPF